MIRNIARVVGFSLMLAFWGCEGEETAVSASGDSPGLTGSVEVMIASFEDRSEVSYFLVPKESGRIQLIFDADPGLESDDRITVFGERNAQGDIFVERFEFVAKQFRSLEVPGELRPPTLHKVAVLLLQGTTITKQQVQSTIALTNSFYQENSNGIDSFEGAVFGPYDVDTHECAIRFEEIRDDALAAFAAEGHKESDYTHVAFVIPSEAGCGWGGLGGVGRPDRPARYTWYNNWFDCSVVAHEFGHNVGFFHSHSLDCGSEIYRESGASCTMAEYGHPFDNMGSGNCDTHYSAPQKQYQGWLERCDDVTVGRSDVFNLSPLEGAFGIRSLRVPISGEDNYYYVEYRKDDAGQYAGAQDADRVLVSVSSDGLESRPDMSLLDFQSDTTTFKDAWLEVGMDYTLPGGVTLKVLSLGAAAKVRIDVGTSSKHECAGGTKPPVAADGSIGMGSEDDCEIDADGDGTVDCHDSCPNDSGKVQPGICGCGRPEGSCSADETRYEAENRASENGCRKATSHVGFTGTGFMDFGGDGTWIEWDNIAADHASQYTLTFRYANGGGSARRAVIVVNGQNRGDVSFSTTGGWTNWRTDSITVPLKKGNNTIRVEATTSSGGPNLDNVVVFGVAATDNCPDDPDKMEPGECGCGVPEGTCGELANVALGKNTRQSSIAWNGASSRAVDGNTSGKYNDGSTTHTGFDNGAWWQVDLGGAHRVEGVTLWNRTDCCSNRLSNFHVDYLDDRGEVIVTKNHSGQASTRTDLDLAAQGVFAVRVQLAGTNYLSLAEIQVWGSGAAGDAGDAGDGLKGTYFENADFTDRVLERVDSTVDFDWQKGAPDPSMGSDTFSVVWTGYVKAKFTEEYTFYTVSDDGVRLYVDNRLITDDWTLHPPRENSGAIFLEAGELYPIRMEYYENGGGAVARLLWSSSSQPKQIVPMEQLFSGAVKSP